MLMGISLVRLPVTNETTSVQNVIEPFFDEKALSLDTCISRVESDFVPSPARSELISFEKARDLTFLKGNISSYLENEGIPQVKSCIHHEDRRVCLKLTTKGLGGVPKGNRSGSQLT